VSLFDAAKTSQQGFAVQQILDLVRKWGGRFVAQDFTRGGLYDVVIQEQAYASTYISI
jgi:hypothetical protein